MKRLTLALVLLLSLALAPAAAAHPLGNFTVNRYSELTLAGDRVYVRYVLDLAEIPTFQDGPRVRKPAFAQEAGRKLVLQLDGRRVTLRSLGRAVRTRPGAGGLDIMRFEAVYESPRVRGSQLEFRDRNFASRRGWREVVVTARDGATVRSSTAPATSRSHALTRYPRALLTEPLHVDSATVSYRAGSRAGDPPALGALGPAERGSAGFERLVTADLTPGFVLLSLVLALFWGAAHALSPGHGKAIVAGYLVGSRGTPRHAVLLGGIVTVTHTIGVFALGLVTLALSEFFLPEQLYPWLNLVAALLVVCVGVGILRARVRHARAHAHGHHHHEVRGLVGVGISAGIVPCPTALVVLLAAISLHRVGYGLVLILAFSLGLAAAVTGIGLVAVTAKRFFGRLRFDGILIRALPAVSALIVIGLGVVMTARAFPQL
ncbi:MAG TPA: sulfite exporter TauE/SafE family protein [Gaiellaceae bacterium]|nr:sulfite exporter TauE/SafE family protein [Gaiellaceae bacterium]